MNITILTNGNSKKDAIIVSETSTNEDIAYAMGITKAKNENWTFEELISNLPKDCKVIKNDEIKRAYY